jgi:hypothetical protein
VWSCDDGGRCVRDREHYPKVSQQRLVSQLHERAIRHDGDDRPQQGNGPGGPDPGHVHQRPRDHENHEDAREDSDDGHEQASPRSATARAAASEARSRSDVEREPEDEAEPARDTGRREHAANRRARTRFVPAGRTGSHACIMAGAGRQRQSVRSC